LFNGGPGDIPIVHTVYDIYVSWNEIILKFPKSQRYTLGETCSKYILTILENLLFTASAGEVSEKLPKLKTVSAEIDTLKLLVRLAKDCKCVANNQYQKIESLLNETGKMLGGWIKSFGKDWMDDKENEKESL
jgi:four helix bundle protein